MTFINIDVFENLLNKIKNTTEIDEFAYLIVKDKKEAFAFYKNNTKLFDIKDWQKFHEKYKVIVNDSSVLRELIATKQFVATPNTHNLNPRIPEFELLNLYSVYLFPVIYNSTVIGFIDLAYKNQYHNLDIDKLKEIQDLINLNILEIKKATMDL